MFGIQSDNYRNSFPRGVLISRKSVTLSHACEGMIRYKQATGNSENTIADWGLMEFSVHLQEEYLVEPDAVESPGRFELFAKTCAVPFKLFQNMYPVVAGVLDVNF